jgi:hypothetical protein
MNIQEKEQLIIGTILHCNNEIKKLSNHLNLKNLMEKNNMYHFTMIQLYSDIEEDSNIKLFENFENKISKITSYGQNTRGNFYAYFNSVFNFLNGFEPNIQHSLNESLKPLNESAQELNIFTFKDDLKKIMKILETKNEIENLPQDILKIKILAGKPIFVLGFDICNSIALKKELQEKFSIKMQDLFSVLFDKTNKQLIFVTSKSFTNTICYDLKTDVFDYYHIVNPETTLSNFEFGKDYFAKIKEQIGTNLLEIWLNIENLKIEFSDNLYLDKIRQQTEIAKREMSSVVKK